MPRKTPTRIKQEELAKEIYPITADILPVNKIAHYVNDGLKPVLDGYYLVDATGRRLTDVLPVTLCEDIREGLILKYNADHAPITNDGKQGMMLCHIVIPLNPPSKKNSMMIVKSKQGYSKLIPNAKYRQCLTDICKLGNTIFQFKRDRVNFPIDYPVRIVCHYYRDSHRVIDATNLESALADILVSIGVLSDDDSKIFHNGDGRRVFFDKDSPRTECWIYKWLERKTD